MMEAGDRFDLAIVGGGIGGLTAAWRLTQSRPALRIALFESGAIPGGKIRTKTVEHDAGQFLIETGPDCFLAQKPWARDLAEELGLGNELEPNSAMPRGVAIQRKGRLVDWPAGMSLVAPTAIRPFLLTSLFSPAGKIRMALEPLAPVRRGDGDESVGSFVRRRLGREALEWIAEPLLAGIYNADPDELSLMATFPQLRTLEGEHGSLIRGLRATGKQPRGHRPAPFLSLRDGMQMLPDALVQRLGNVVKRNSPVTSVTRDTEGSYRLVINERDEVSATAIVLATPAKTSGELLAAIAPAAAPLAARMLTSNSGSMSMAFPAEALRGGPPGYGVVLPRREQRPFNAVTVMSRKFPGRAPDGWVLLRLFFGGARSPESMHLDDQEILPLAMTELRRIYGIETEPEFFAVSRWPVGNPLYEVGHLERVAEIERLLPAGVFITGSAWRGVGIPDVIRDANRVAAVVAESLDVSRKSSEIMQRTGVMNR